MCLVGREPGSRRAEREPHRLTKHPGTGKRKEKPQVAVTVIVVFLTFQELTLPVKLKYNVTFCDFKNLR